MQVARRARAGDLRRRLARVPQAQRGVVADRREQVRASRAPDHVLDLLGVALRAQRSAPVRQKGAARTGAGGARARTCSTRDAFRRRAPPDSAAPASRSHIRTCGARAGARFGQRAARPQALKGKGARAFLSLPPLATSAARSAMSSAYHASLVWPHRVRSGVAGGVPATCGGRPHRGGAGAWRAARGAASGTGGADRQVPAVLAVVGEAPQVQLRAVAVRDDHVGLASHFDHSVHLARGGARPPVRRDGGRCARASPRAHGPARRRPAAQPVPAGSPAGCSPWRARTSPGCGIARLTLITLFSGGHGAAGSCRATQGA